MAKSNSTGRLLSNPFVWSLARYSVRAGDDAVSYSCARIGRGGHPILFEVVRVNVQSELTIGSRCEV
jgi:hypothetical protein